MIILHGWARGGWASATNSTRKGLAFWVLLGVAQIPVAWMQMRSGNMLLGSAIGVLWIAQLIIALTRRATSTAAAPFQVRMNHAGVVQRDTPDEACAAPDAATWSRRFMLPILLMILVCALVAGANRIEISPTPDRR
jgi:hypothetical protein